MGVPSLGGGIKPTQVRMPCWITSFYEGFVHLSQVEMASLLVM